MLQPATKLVPLQGSCCITGVSTLLVIATRCLLSFCRDVKPLGLSEHFHWKYVLWVLKALNHKVSSTYLRYDNACSDFIWKLSNGERSTDCQTLCSKQSLKALTLFLEKIWIAAGRPAAFSGADLKSKTLDLPGQKLQRHMADPRTQIALLPRQYRMCRYIWLIILKTWDLAWTYYGTPWRWAALLCRKLSFVIPQPLGLVK